MGTDALGVAPGEQREPSGAERSVPDRGSSPAALSAVHVFLQLLPQFLISHSSKKVTPSQAVNYKDDRVPGLLVPSKGQYTTIRRILLSCSAETKTPKQVEDGDDILTASTQNPD